MKKGGIINPKLMEQLTELGHYDSFVVCDSGFPIPRGAVRIDLSLVPGIPSFRQVLAAVLGEVVVQKITIMEAMDTANRPLHEEVTALFAGAEIERLDMVGFRKACSDAAFFVRTGETAPCSNMLLVSASGVPEKAQRFAVDPPAAWKS